MQLTTKKFVVTIVCDPQTLNSQNERRLRVALEEKAQDSEGVYFSSCDPVSHTAKVIEAPEPPDADDSFAAFDRWEKQYVLPLA